MYRSSTSIPAEIRLSKMSWGQEHSCSRACQRYAAFDVRDPGPYRRPTALPRHIDCFSKPLFLYIFQGQGVLCPRIAAKPRNLFKTLHQAPSFALFGHSNSCLITARLTFSKPYRSKLPICKRLTLFIFLIKSFSTSFNFEIGCTFLFSIGGNLKYSPYL